MTNNSEFCITREKHLDHMVRVVPFIVTAYAIQCYFITQMGPIEIGVNALLTLGVCLVAMISCFVIYDLTHTVKMGEDKIFIQMKWLGYDRSISYQDISEIKTSDPGHTFSTLFITTRQGKKYGFYFVDEADKIKAWIEKKRAPELQQAA